MPESRPEVGYLGPLKHLPGPEAEELLSLQPGGSGQLVQVDTENLEGDHSQKALLVDFEDASPHLLESEDALHEAELPQEVTQCLLLAWVGRKVYFGKEGLGLIEV